MSTGVVEAGASTRARKRRRRAMVTIIGLVAALFLAFWWAYSYYRNPPASNAARPTAKACVTKAAPKITVNVYNATSKDGLAARTAAELKKRGFIIGAVSNDPKKKKVAGVAEVRYGPASGKYATSVVIPLLPKATGVNDKRPGATVDLVLGNAFTALPAAPTKAATPTCS